LEVAFMAVNTPRKANPALLLLASLAMTLGAAAIIYLADTFLLEHLPTL
jgi:hypothetical protein